MSESEQFQVRSMRKKGWFWLDNAIIDRFSEVIGYAALGVYVVLCRRADNDDQSCYPSISGLSHDLKMGRDKVIESLTTLQEVGLIRCDRAGKNSGVNNTYYILDLPEGSPKVGLLQSDEKKSQGETTSSPTSGLPVVPRQDSKEDSVKDSFKKTHTASGAVQENLHEEMNLIPAMEKIHLDHPNRKAVKWVKPKGDEAERLKVAERTIGKLPVLQAWCAWLKQDDPGEVRSFCYAVSNGFRGLKPKRQRAEIPDADDGTGEESLKQLHKEIFGGGDDTERFKKMAKEMLH